MNAMTLMRNKTVGCAVRTFECHSVRTAHPTRFFGTICGHE